MSEDLLNKKLWSDENKVHKVWCKGERCLAPWSTDGKHYSGIIKKLQHHETGSVSAVVQFDDYPDDEWEEIAISELQIIPRKKKTRQDVTMVISDTDSLDESMFKPLCGEEETSWLNQKYSRFDTDSDECLDSSSNSTLISAGKKTSAVAFGGAERPLYKTRKYKSQTRKEKEINTPNIKSTDDSKVRASTSTHRHSVKKDDIDKEHSQQKKISKDVDVDDLPEIEGFDEEDMEKPKFKFTPSAAKIPFLLSEPEETPAVQVPSVINQYLRDYQREGIKFMYSHYKEGRGAILGDDMGLGKTVQVISFIAAILRKQGNRIDVLRQKPKFIRQMSDNARLLTEYKDIPASVFLIIGPGSVLYNWLDEFETWGYFTVGKYHGTEKNQCLRDLMKGKYEIVVTTFETFRDNLEEMNSVDWTAVFVDEVHKIKGLKAHTTQALRSIKTNLRFGLTGTALQNNMEELWCILDWSQPGSLGSISRFKDDYINPIEKGQKNDATKRELALARKKKENFAKMRNAMMIRRTKKLIEDQLPAKDDNVVFCKLTDLQIGVYKAILNHPGMEFVMTMDDPCTCGSGLKQKDCHKEAPDGSTLSCLKFTFMHLLLKTASHVALLLPEKSASDLSDYSKEVCKYVFEKFPQFFSETKAATFQTLSNPKFCGKMKVLQGLLRIFNKDHSKVLIFSYSTKILDILEQYMMTTGYEYRRLDGSTAMKKRMIIVREFNNDHNIFIFLISTKAGGLGLNLTGANRVVIFDPNWNPTHDLQAQDRAYRIGQRRNVHVYRLISAGTIEENMYLRQVYKQQLDGVAVSSLNAKRYFTGIAGDPTQKGELFGWKNMFQLRTGESCLTMDILKRNENLESAISGFEMSKYIPLVTKGDNDSDTDNLGSDLDTSTEDSTTEDDTDKAFAKMFGLDELSSDETEIDQYSSPDSDSEINSSRSRTKKCKKAQKASHTNKQNFSKSKTDLPKKGTDPDDAQSKKRSKSQKSKVEKEERNSGSFSSVGDLFEDCGVLHVHENRKVVGSSKMEDHMSRCALQDVFELHQNSQIPAAYCEPLTESDVESDSFDIEKIPKKKGKGKEKPDHNATRTQVIGNAKVLIGQTPKAIRQQQFQKLCKHQGIRCVTDLAEKVLKCSMDDRLEMLADFYGQQNTEYRKIFEKSQIDDDTPVKSVMKCCVRQKKKMASSSSRKRDRLNQTLGVTFDNSESQNSVKRHSSDIDRLSEGSWNVGKMIGPRKTKKSPVKTRLRTTSKSVKSVNQSKSLTKRVEISDSETKHYVQELYYEGSSGVIPSSSSDSEDHEVLLQTMVRDPDTQEVPIDNVKDEKEKETDNNPKEVSVLDDIFSDEGTSYNRKRRPPPTSKKKGQNKELDELMTDTSSCNDELDGLLNESTLKDDSYDCFSDPPKWKRKKRKIEKPLSAVDRLIVEGDQEYQNLFSSGKMKKNPKILPTKEKPIMASDKNNFDLNTSDQEEVKSFDGSKSLFSD